MPIWRARWITEYCQELLPPEPVPLPVKESLDSLVDIIDYLEQQYGRGDARNFGVEEEGSSHPPPPSSPVIAPGTDIGNEENTEM